MSQKRRKRIPQSQAVQMMNRLEAVKKVLTEKRAELNPMFYGLPDLLFPQEYGAGVLDPEGNILREKEFPGESVPDWQDRQDAALEVCVREFLRVTRDGESSQPVLIPEMLMFVSDLFFGRVNKAILWANRGGGKSLAAAILIWLLLVYKKRSIVNMAGTGEQAKRVYEYTVQFWDCVPGIKKGMLDGDPLLKLTELKGKTKLICCSGEQAVGEHLPVFVADEACTDKAQAENNIRRALQGALDHADYIVLFLSTFHHPVGLFQETWDGAAELGYKRYKWNIYDTMGRCSRGLEEATPEDPHAQKYCVEKCALTRIEDKRDDFGKIVGKEYLGCCGHARTSKGWQTFNQVLAKQEINKGTRIYTVEHECNKPKHEGQIYSPALVDRCTVDAFRLDTTARKVVGIDWGLKQCFMVLIGEWLDGPRRGLGVVATRLMSNKLTDEVVAQIRQWQEWFGDEVVIRADDSHPYCNKELRSKRYFVRTVKGDREKIGEDNMQRWLASGLLKIAREHGVLITQLKNLRQDEDGKQIKENRDDERADHGPDAMKFALMAYDYVKWVQKYGTELLLPAGFAGAEDVED